MYMRNAKNVDDILRKQQNNNFKHSFQLKTFQV